MKRTYKKDGDKVFSRACCIRTKGKGFKLKKDQFRSDTRKKFFYSDGGKILEWITQGDGRFHIPGNTQGALSNLISLKVFLLSSGGLD